VTVPVRLVALLAASGVAIALPAAAHAKTKTVAMGVPSKYGKDFDDLGAKVNAFFPKSVAIRAGDTVRFRPRGFHTVDLPPKGESPLSWLAGSERRQRSIPEASTGARRRPRSPRTHARCTATGFWNSGALDRSLAAGLPRSDRVRFNTPGTYTYYCLNHPLMSGTVRVQ
jgi:plastocyanin